MWILGLIHSHMIGVLQFQTGPISCTDWYLRLCLVGDGNYEGNSQIGIQRITERKCFNIDFSDSPSVAAQNPGS